MKTVLRRYIILIGLGGCLALPGFGLAQPRIVQDIAYKANAATEYEEERCKLDLHVPEGKTAYATLIWFHGGSLETGDKADDIASGLARRLTAHGIGVVSVNYRLHPQVQFPAYVHDAAAAVAWTVRHIKSHGGDPAKVVVSGHSAGGYLTAMVGMDERFLEPHDLRPEDLAGYIPVAGQMITHSTVRKERGIDRYTPVIDEAAPSYYARSVTAPFLNICADNDLPARVEENMLFVSFMRATGNEKVRLVQIIDRNHGSVAGSMSEEGDPGLQAVLQFMEDL